MLEDYFKKLFDEYFERVRNYIFYRCGDTDLATDIAQETFMKIWEKDLHPEPKKEKALLFKIAGDLFISNYRKQQVALKFAQLPQNENQTETPDDELRYKELKVKYEKVLSEMNENQRIVFLMSRNEGLKYKEIAEHLSISQKAVEKRMSKALEQLNKALQYEA
jgi:RNA polymerase sigma-70 factor (ECF subfamily)